MKEKKNRFCPSCCRKTETDSDTCPYCGTGYPGTSWKKASENGWKISIQQYTPKPENIAVRYLDIRIDKQHLEKTGS